MKKIKTLSVRQPWAELIVSGEKDVENRGWSTDHRGPVLIHAAKLMDVPGMDKYPVATSHCLAANARQAIVGSAFLYNCTMKQRSDWHEDGLFGWYLADVVRIDRRVELSGQLRLFETKIEDLCGAVLCHRCKANLPGTQSGLCGCCNWWLQTQSEKLAPELSREHRAYQEFLMNRCMAGERKGV